MAVREVIIGNRIWLEIVPDEDETEEEGTLTKSRPRVFDLVPDAYAPKSPDA